MNITVPIPDNIAAKLGSEADLTRRALEALAAAEYRAGRLSSPELRELLGLQTHYEMDVFLKALGVYEAFTVAEIEEQVRTMERLGF